MSSTRSSSPGATGPVVDRFDDEEDVIFLVDSPAASRKGIRTLVAMPAYNEEAAIAKTVLGARRHADAVLVVDDGSTDETAAIAEALGAIVIRHETNWGYGGALQTIFATARRLGAGELVIIDSDGQHDPGEIPDLLAELRQGNDVVLRGEAGTESLDPSSGFGAYGKRAIEAIRISGNGTSIGSKILEQVRDLAVVGVPPAREPRYRGKRIAVVVPAYNEEALIGETLAGIPDYVARVYAVDDGSTDRINEIPVNRDIKFRAADCHIGGY